MLTSRYRVLAGSIVALAPTIAWSCGGSDSTRSPPSAGGADSGAGRGGSSATGGSRDASAGTSGGGAGGTDNGGTNSGGTGGASGAGSGGSAGTSGGADAGGSAGSAGTGGSAASGGSAGSAGSAGTGGSAGTTGTGGSAGTAGGEPCGNGSIETGEDCDDRGAANLDGCDSFCKYELFFRLTAFALASTPEVCRFSENRLGTSIIGAGFNANAPALIAQGQLNLLLRVLRMDDLVGVRDASPRLAFANAALDPAKGTWPGGTPLDWWFLLDGTTLEASGFPALTIPGVTSERALTANTTGEVLLQLPIGPNARLYPIRLLDIRVEGTFAVQANTPAPPPALASLRPGLTATQGLSGIVCGTATVDSLAKVPLPAALATSCSYTFCGVDQAVGPSCNSVLDLLVGGCASAAAPLQPDVEHEGGALPLTLGTNKKVPSAQSDGNTSGYSANYNFSAQRAHATGRQ